MRIKAQHGPGVSLPSSREAAQAGPRQVVASPLSRITIVCGQAAGLSGGHSHTPTFAPGEAEGRQARAASSWAAWVWTEGCPSPSPGATWQD